MAIKMTPLRKSARGQECTLQIHPYCNGNPETVVLCHLPSQDKGMGIKSQDWWSAYGCSSCHDIIDGRAKTNLPREEICMCMFRGAYRTHLIFINQGLMLVKGVNL